jgi:hypothetical protein
MLHRVWGDYGFMAAAILWVLTALIDEPKSLFELKSLISEDKSRRLDGAREMSDLLVLVDSLGLVERFDGAFHVTESGREHFRKLM